MWVRRNDVSLTQSLLSVIPGWLDLEADPSSAGKLNRAMLGDNEEKTVEVPRQWRHGSEMYWSHTLWQVGGNIWWGLKRALISFFFTWFMLSSNLIQLRGDHYQTKLYIWWMKFETLQPKSAQNWLNWVWTKYRHLARFG